MMYRLLTLSTLAPLEPAGPLPAWLVAANPSDDQIADLDWAGRGGQGYFPLHVADDPPFDPSTQRLGEPVEGAPDPLTKTIPVVREVYALTANELTARRAAAVAAMVVAVNGERDRRLTGGFTHDFGGEVGPKTLQTRDAEDKVNWLISRGAYRDAVAAGHGAVPGATFRSADNTTFTVTIAAGLAALVAMETWGAAVMARSWALKDTLAAGADPVGFDVTTGWPE